MLLLKLTFWLLLIMIFYTYVGYGMLVFFMVGRRKRPLLLPNPLPKVAHIIAAYNEAGIIERKLENALRLDYPTEQLRTIVVADGSDDGTDVIAKGFAGVEVLFLPERKGKAAAINRAVEQATDSEILIFSDANTVLNKSAFRLIVRHYSDPVVGGVSAEKKVMSVNGHAVRGEGIYWRYESALKNGDGAFHSVVGAAGELFSVRRTSFKPLPENAVLDDLLISMQVCRGGQVVRYEPDAYAIEEPSSSLMGEFQRKTRISAGAWQALGLTADLLNPFRYGKLAWQYLSHRVLRWVVCPLAVPLILLLNIILVFDQSHQPDAVYVTLLSLQIICWVLGGIGWILTLSGIRFPSFIYLPFYFLFMHAASLAGWIRHLRGGQSAAWDKVRRAVPFR